MRELRVACAAVAQRARCVQIDRAALAEYARGLRVIAPGPDSEVDLQVASVERRAAFWLTLDAVNFGSGWFPTLRKRPGRSGYLTVASGVRERFTQNRPWSASRLARIDAKEVAETLGQDPQHELMALFAASLRDLGRRVSGEHRGSFAELAACTGGSAVALALRLGSWPCFADRSSYRGIEVPFLKRAQIAAADLARAGVIQPHDLSGLTMFADNLVPHVLRLDGILRFDADLVARIDRGELIEHGAPEEVEIRACALHAVELIVAARTESGLGGSAAEIDQLLWLRGQGASYKAAPRHRSRCTAY
jgi:putative queuosine salvage protein